MSKSPALTFASLDVTPQAVAGAVLVAVDLAATAGERDAPEWIKLTPAGRIDTRDGRSYEFDPAALAARFAEFGTELAVDIDHALSRDETGDGAVGWISKVEARSDGLYGLVEWLDKGREVLKARTRRYISPTFTVDDAGKAGSLLSVALVASPALPNMPALAQAGQSDRTQTEPPMKAIAKALGLAEDADETACLSAIGKLTPATGDTVSSAVHEEALASLKARTDELASLKAANRKAEVDGVIEQALKDKKILPAQKDHYNALCATDDGLKSVKALLEATTSKLGASGLDGKTVETGSDTEVDYAACGAAARTAMAQASGAGILLDYDAAFDAEVAKAKKGAGA